MHQFAFTRCLAVVPCLAVLLLLMGIARADGNPALKEALILQEAVQRAIEEAEPAIACILVSRSDIYAKLGQGPATDDSGKLGRFNLDKAQLALLDHVERKNLEKYRLDNPTSVPEAYGSGVVVDESGLILTNEHVIRDATKVYVRLPGFKGSYADIHAADPRSDLAVLKLLDPPPGLRAIRLGDGGKAKKGQWVISLANPFAAGFRDGSPSASWGIIGNVRRRAPGTTNELDRKKTLHHYGTLLQTDARLNLGCSGGALIDLKGELIGLTSSLAAISGSETAGGFAVPIDAGIRRIIEVLKKGEEVEYGFLGVQLSQETARQERGVTIQDVTPWSPASRAGLRGGDTIVSVNESPVYENDELFLAVGMQLAGTETRLAVRSPAGQLRTVTVTLAKFYVPGRIIASRKPAPVRGLRVDYVSVLLQSSPSPALSLQGIPGGVMIREVLPGSPAATALLKVNDVITHVNDQTVNTPAEFYREMQRANGPLVLRLDQARQVKVN